MMLCVLLALYLQLKERPRPFLSGAFSVAGAFFWLPGAIFVAITLAQSRLSSKPRNTRLTALGMALSGLLIILPVVDWGVVEPMVLEVVLVPILTPEKQYFLHRVMKLVFHLRASAGPVLLGTCGLLIAWLARCRLRRSWWLLVGGAWFAIQLMLFDYDSQADLFLTLLFSSFGMSLLIDWLSTREDAGLAVFIVVLIVLFPVALRGVPWGLDNLDRLAGSPASRQETGSRGSCGGASGMRHVYWNKVEPEGCHYRLSAMEEQWIRRTGQTGDEQVCGQITVSNALRLGLSSHR
jgi:hypothetical protein